MVIDTTTPRSRRALLAGTLGGAVALVAGALGRPLAARAADGDAIRVGHKVRGTGDTGITTTGDYGLYAVSSSVSGVGLSGFATATSGKTFGVNGRSDSPDGVGVFGAATSGAGVIGSAAAANGTGVTGQATATSGLTIGVFGISSSPDGIGIAGVAGIGDLTIDDHVRGGRGGVFGGSAAQLRLMPGSTAHPASGQLGDLFLDDSGALWFCKGDTTWKQIA
jgi:hypothetical protein